jgi:hypothetical protein
MVVDLFSASGNNLLKGGGSGPLRDKNPRIHIIGPTGPWTRPTWNPWYPAWYPIQPPITPNPPPSKESLPYPIYTTRMDPNTHVRMFHKAIHTNGEKTNVDIVNLFYFTFHDAIFEWGENFMQTHPICKFEELQVAFCKRYQKVQMNEQVYITLRMIKQGGNKKVEVYYDHILKLTNSLQH